MSAENQKSTAAEILVCLKCFTLLNKNSITDHNISVPLHYSYNYTSPPITWTKSGVRTNGAHSRLIPCSSDDNKKLSSNCCYFTDPGAYFEVLYIAKEVSKVNMEEIARCSHHDVVVMTITNTLVYQVYSLQG